MIGELLLIMQLVTAYPVVYEGKLNHRPAIVHYSGTHFFVVYIHKTIWGIVVHEVKKVDAKTFEEEVLFVAEEVKT